MAKKLAVVNTDTGERFESTADAAKSVGIKTSSMSNHLRGRSGTAGGYRFQYERVLEMRRQANEGDGFIYLPKNYETS